MPMIIGSTQSLSVSPFISFISNAFSFGMSSIGMQNVSTSSQPITQNLNFGVGSSSTPLQVVPWGGGISLHHSLHLEVGLSHILGLIPSWDGVVI
jgi:hypothetical protein